MSEIIHVFKVREGLELNDYLFPNLAVDIKQCSSKKQDTDLFIENAVRFIEKISGDPANLKRWLNRYGRPARSRR